MQYKVPQHIDIEDKIVGPFTMRQFLYLLVGGFILYGWWNYSNTFESPPPMMIFLILGLPVGLLSICLALVKVNDRPFEFFLINIFRFLISPKQRKWVTGYSPEAVIKMDGIEKQEKKEEAKTETDLDSLAKSLEQQTAQIKANTPPPTANQAKKPESVNLSVKDTAAAQTAHQESHGSSAAPASPKKGILGIFK